MSRLNIHQLFELFIAFPLIQLSSLVDLWVYILEILDGMTQIPIVGLNSLDGYCCNCKLVGRNGRTLKRDKK